VKKPIPFGKYYLLERMNVGGMAEVFRAKAYGVEGFERLVAVKRILPNIAEDKEFIRMFIDEAKIAVQLNHANIAQIFDLGVVDSSYYIALEHIHGRDLRAIFDRCRNHGEPMPIAQACFVIMKVCEGLDYAHNKRDQGGGELNLVHRDVSPQNVLTSFEGEVKLIDFGIAKAAGKGSKTQAGILKGKFGYMSPEQVRGLPIDRRSDVFSCGIVLYELLTGERLFVGESDFSTLEKVRNVEILPPSTYNRRIPDELERIVLKALAKDVEDRYHNAIDLHDELQAFVYTAGEFYSRKDLAAWMKRTFAHEIEEETAKLEGYRQIQAPESARTPRPTRNERMPEAPRRATLAMPSIAPQAPPPIPAKNGRRNPSAPPNGAPMGARRQRGSDLDWDDDELETAIYDGPEDQVPAAMLARAVGGPALPASQQSSGAMTLPGTGPHEPDLSSLVNRARSWNDGQPPPQAGASPQLAQLPGSLAEGSDQARSPYDNRDPSAIAHLSNVGGGAEPIYDSGFGGAFPTAAPSKSKAGVIAAIVAVVLLLGGGGLAIFFIAKRGSDAGEKAAQSSATAASEADDLGDSAEAGIEKDAKEADPGGDIQPTPAVVDPNTGFDLVVDPTRVAVKLDGKPIGTAPLQIRNLAEGDHFVEIEAPAGFFNKSQTVTVERGTAPRVNIKLDAMEVVGTFRSDPPGARVTLVSNGNRVTLGRSPIESKLDPRQRYEVVFKKDNYVTVTRPVEISGGTEVSVAVSLERTRTNDSDATSSRPRVASPGKTVVVRKADKVDTASPPRVEKADDPPPRDTPDKGKDKDSDSSSGGFGTLMLGAKPPCKIYIDGRNTGKRTPQRAIRLKAGRHRITLVNNEFGIKETFTVKIKANDTTRAIKNMTDKMK